MKDVVAMIKGANKWKSKALHDALRRRPNNDGDVGYREFFSAQTQ